MWCVCDMCPSLDVSEHCTSRTEKYEMVKVLAAALN